MARVSCETGTPTHYNCNARVHSGDVILKVNDAPVEHSSDLVRRNTESAPGSRASLQVWRDRKALTLTARVAEVAARPTDASDSAGNEGAAQSGRLGVSVRELAPEEPGAAGGVMVEQSAGPAADAGIEPGDVILAVNGNTVRSVAQLRAAVSRAGSTVAVLVARGDVQLYVPVHLG